jgi:ADP-ribosylglycohydrolase
VSGIGLTESELYDKILGILVGAAIGDAMEAPTEMWPGEGIELEYGFVDGLLDS